MKIYNIVAANPGCIVVLESPENSGQTVEKKVIAWGVVEYTVSAKSHEHVKTEVMPMILSDGRLVPGPLQKNYVSTKESDS